MFGLVSQANIVLIISIIQFLFFEGIVLFASGLTAASKAYLFFIILLFMTIGTFFIVYALNCMIIGNCNVFAWLIAGIIIISFLFAVISFIITGVVVYNNLLGDNITANLNNIINQNNQDNSASVITPSAVVVNSNPTPTTTTPTTTTPTTTTPTTTTSAS